MMRKLIADVKPGDVIRLEVAPWSNSEEVLVRTIVWLTHSETMVINGELLYLKDSWVEVK